tara:strand:+ start:886 stop:1032 length:147 start_codon:yes stop_codon:yes gene_type:complete
MVKPFTPLQVVVHLLIPLDLHLLLTTFSSVVEAVPLVIMEVVLEVAAS